MRLWPRVHPDPSLFESSTPGEDYADLLTQIELVSRPIISDIL